MKLNINFSNVQNRKVIITFLLLKYSFSIFFPFIKCSESAKPLALPQKTSTLEFRAITSKKSTLTQKLKLFRKQNKQKRNKPKKAAISMTMSQSTGVYLDQESMTLLPLVQL